jgi:hypothetical protein
MKINRSIIVLLILAALVIPQGTPVLSAPLSADRTLNLQPGDTVTVNCPTKLLPNSASNTKVQVLCRQAATPATATAGINATVTATAGVTAIATATVTAHATAISTATAATTAASTAAANATVTATQPSTPTVSQQVVDLSPLDTLTINCPTKLIQKSASRNKLKLLCRPVTATQTLEPTATQTPISNATQSPQPTATHPMSMPTATQMSMSTMVAPPLVTPTRGPGGLIQPYANAPACPSHNPNTWHGIWDYQRGCHYDHTHGDDPSLANVYFGTFGALWGGTTISYPFNSGPMENTMKHNGYKVSVRMPGYHPFPKCGTEDNTDITGDNSDNCVVAARVEYHLVGGLMDIIARYHSFFAEIYVCSGKSNYTQCGVIRTGGLVDYGQLQAPHYNARVVRPGGTIDFGDGMMMTYSADGPDLPNKSGEPMCFQSLILLKTWRDIETIRRTILVQSPVHIKRRLINGVQMIGTASRNRQATLATTCTHTSCFKLGMRGIWSTRKT